MTLSASNVCRQRENGFAVRHSVPGNVNLGKGRLVILIAPIGDICRSQMRLTALGAEM
jgi:hypothetical protein